MILGPETPAVVTGGASGLGAATCRHLAARGCKVGILDRDAARGEALAAELDGQFVPCDVTDDAEVARALAACAAEHGPARLAVACAGIAPARRIVGRDRETGLPLPHDTGLFAQVIAVNLVGTFRLFALAGSAMAMLPPLEGGERGVLVATASIAAEDGQVGQTAYAASKAAIAGMMLPAARDLADAGIRAVAIMPGLFDTALLATLPPEVRGQLEARIPFPPRLGEPAEFAALVAHIAENPMLNGTAIRLDGALRMPPR
jgi:NAD(P)-dependent dehydrogenase (short-subunit alcohol dehydrogenase family)